MVLRRCIHFEEKIDKPAQIQALDCMRKRRPTFLVNIFNVIQKFREYKFFEPENTSILSILQNVSYI